MCYYWYFAVILSSDSKIPMIYFFVIIRFGTLSMLSVPRPWVSSPSLSLIVPRRKEGLNKNNYFLVICICVHWHSVGVQVASHLCNSLHTNQNELTPLPRKQRSTQRMFIAPIGHRRFHSKYPECLRESSNDCWT